MNQPTIQIVFGGVAEDLVDGDYALFPIIQSDPKSVVFSTTDQHLIGSGDTYKITETYVSERGNQVATYMVYLNFVEPDAKEDCYMKEGDVDDVTITYEIKRPILRMEVDLSEFRTLNTNCAFKSEPAKFFDPVYKVNYTQMLFGDTIILPTPENPNLLTLNFYSEEQVGTNNDVIILQDYSFGDGELRNFKPYNLRIMMVRGEDDPCTVDQTPIDDVTIDYPIKVPNQWKVVQLSNYRSLDSHCQYTYQTAVLYDLTTESVLTEDKPEMGILIPTDGRPNEFIINSESKELVGKEVHLLVRQQVKFDGEEGL